MTTEPTGREMFNAATAMSPFARRWRLQLNPEDLDQIAYAVLRHARSDAPPEEIVAEVERQIDEHEERLRLMLEAMTAHHDRKRAAAAGE